MTKIKTFLLLLFGYKPSYHISFWCLSDEGWNNFSVKDILIRDMKVIDWGEVTEER